MHRAAGILALAALVVLAGCSGLSGEETPTLSPVAVPADDPRSDRLPTGNNQTDRSIDPLATATTHVSQLGSTAYVRTGRRTVRSPVGVVRSDRRTLRRFGPNRTRVYERVTVIDRDSASDGGKRVEQWRNRSLSLFAITVDNRTRYLAPVGHQQSVRHRGLYTSQPRGNNLFSKLSVLRPSVVNRSGFPQRVRIEAHHDSPPDTFDRFVRGRDARNVTFRAKIGPSGVIRQRVLRYRVTLRGEPVQVVRRVRYPRVGNVTIDRPPWYEEARRATDRG